MKLHLMAAALATGSTTITSAQKIQRGYGDLVERAADLSLSISAA